MFTHLLLLFTLTKFLVHLSNFAPLLLFRLFTHHRVHPIILPTTMPQAAFPNSRFLLLMATTLDAGARDVRNTFVSMRLISLNGLVWLSTTWKAPLLVGTNPSHPNCLRQLESPSVSCSTIVLIAINMSLSYAKSLVSTNKP